MDKTEGVEISMDWTPAQLLGWTTTLLLLWPFVVLFGAACLVPPVTGAWGTQQLFLPIAIGLSVLPVAAQGFLTWFQHSRLRMSGNSMMWLGSFAVFCLSAGYVVFIILFSHLSDSPLYTAATTHSGFVVIASALSLVGLIFTCWNAGAEEKKLHQNGTVQHAAEKFGMDIPRKAVGKLAFVAAVIPFMVLIPTGLYTSAYAHAEALQAIPTEYQLQ
jgi:hypothetical protein